MSVIDDFISRASAPQKPISEIEPRYRLGTWIRRRRIEKEVSLGDLARAMGMSLVVLGQVERGMMPMTAEKLTDLVAYLGPGDTHPDQIFQYARDFSEAIFNATDNLLQVIDQQALEAGGIPAHAFEMPAEQKYVEYREGWIAGASGRRLPDDMSHEWTGGYEEGRIAFDLAMHAKKALLKIEYDDQGPEDR